MSEREPRWDIDYEHGRQAELWVSDIRESLESEAVEVKHDMKALDTQRVYVEYECLRRGAWTKSGIATTEAQLWIFVLDLRGLLLGVSVERLRETARAAYKDPALRRECKRGSHPTRGVTIPIAMLLGARVSSGGRVRPADGAA